MPAIPSYVSILEIDKTGRCPKLTSLALKSGRSERLNLPACAAFREGPVGWWVSHSFWQEAAVVEVVAIR